MKNSEESSSPEQLNNQVSSSGTGRRKRNSASAPPSADHSVPKRTRHAAQRQAPIVQNDQHVVSRILSDILDVSVEDESGNDNVINLISDEENDDNAEIIASGVEESGNFRQCEEDIARIQQLETDEALARQLQREFEAEEEAEASAIQVHLQTMMAAEDSRRPTTSTRLTRSATASLYADDLSELADIQLSDSQERHPRVSRVRQGSSSAGTNAPGPSRQLVVNMRTRPNRFHSLIVRLLAENNVDDDSYEAMLEMVERVGDVRKEGMTKAEIGQLSTVTYKLRDRAEDRSCVVCMNEYKGQEKLRLLPCSHRFHKNCIDRWLTNRGSCPVCRCDARQQSEDTVNQVPSTEAPSSS